MNDDNRRIIESAMLLDERDDNLLLGENMSTPNGKWDCWVCPHPNGKPVEHNTRFKGLDDHYILTRLMRSEQRLDWAWNGLTRKQRKTFLDAAVAGGMDPAHLDAYDPVTLKVRKAAKV